MSPLSRFIGIPFVDGGRTFDGCDCWGLYRLAALDLAGVMLPDFKDQYRDIDDRQGIAGAFHAETSDHYWMDVPASDVSLGDAVVMRIGQLPLHIGMVIKPGMMLHIEKGINACLEHYSRSLWRRRIFGFYRPRPFLTETVQGKLQDIIQTL